MTGAATATVFDGACGGAFNEDKRIAGSEREVGGSAAMGEGVDIAATARKWGCLCNEFGTDSGTL